MTLTTDTCGCVDHERTTMTRRGVLGRALAAGAAGALGGLVSEGLSTQLAFAAPNYTGDVVVVLSLRGGFDGLSAVVPAGDPEYYRARPNIAVPQNMVIGGGRMFGLNPALAPLLPLWQGGQLGAVHAVGQPKPNRSHFAAMEELERAAPGTSLRTGWLDRMLGTAGATSPFSAVSVGTSQPVRLLAGPSPDLGLSSVERFKLHGESTSRPMAATLKALYTGVPAAVAGPAMQVTDALATAAKVGATPYTPANGVVYPNTSLGKALSDVARLIKANVGLMAACVDSGDWDLHESLGKPAAGQRMYDRLAALAGAMAAFAADLGPTGLSGVTLLTISEFGRRVQENGSRGLDHGYGNAMLLLGGGVRGGQVYGTWPGLAPAKLLNGDLPATTDYRSVIAEILQKRCGLGDVSAVFPGVAASRYGLVTAR